LPQFFLEFRERVIMARTSIHSKAFEESVRNSGVMIPAAEKLVGNNLKEENQNKCHARSDLAAKSDFPLSSVSQ
jgi:hypothetical protein